MHLYDTAVVEKFKELFGSDNIFIIPPERAKDTIAQLERDDIKFPLVSLDRRGFSIRDNAVSWSASRMGLADSITDEGKANIMHVIPIKINYQLDVFTTDRVSCDEILRELIFYFTLHPTLMVDIPYGLNTQHKFNLFFNPDIEDNSDTVEHLNRGVLYRYTANIYTDDAYLFANTPVDLVVCGIKPEAKIEEENRLVCDI